LEYIGIFRGLIVTKGRYFRLTKVDILTDKAVKSGYQLRFISKYLKEENNK